MSEISAIRNAYKAEKALAKSGGIAEKMVLKPKNIVKTATGAEVDISRGYNVKGPDGLKIPFNVDTPLEKAKVWTKNFYSKFEVETAEDTKGVVKGEGALMRFDIKPDQYQIKFSEVQEKGTGKGAGMYRQLFEQAQKDGKKVVSDTLVSKEAAAVWRRFKTLGYPIKEDLTHVTDMSGGHYHSSTPIFELDTSKPFPGKPKVEEVPKKVEVDPVDRELRDTLRGKNVAPNDRDELTGMHLDYQAATDPKVKADIASKLKAKLKASVSAGPPGLIAAGNIDLDKRKVLDNKDGTFSTEQSFSIGTDEGEVLIPQVVDGVKLSKEEAIDHYRKTGEHLGIFKDRKSADAYAEKLHEAQEKKYAPKKEMQKVEPGLYFDEDSNQYIHVDENGKHTPVDPHEAH